MFYFDSGERSVSFGHERIQFKSFQRICSTPFETLLSRQSVKLVICDPEIRIGQSRVCQRVAWIFLNGLLEILDGLVKSFLRFLIPKEESHQIRLRVLHGENIREILIETARPEGLAIVHRDQLHGEAHALNRTLYRPF